MPGAPSTRSRAHANAIASAAKRAARCSRRGGRLVYLGAGIVRPHRRAGRRRTARHFRARSRTASSFVLAGGAAQPFDARRRRRGRRMRRAAPRSRALRLGEADCRASPSRRAARRLTPSPAPRRRAERRRLRDRASPTAPARPLLAARRNAPVYSRPAPRLLRGSTRLAAGDGAEMRAWPHLHRSPMRARPRLSRAG